MSHHWENFNLGSFILAEMPYLLGFGQRQLSNGARWKFQLSEEYLFFFHLYSNMSGWGLALGSHIQQSLQQKLSVHQSVEGGVLLFTGRQVLFSVRWTTSVNVLWLYLSITAISFSACLFQPASLPISEVYEHIHSCFHAFEASVSLKDLSVLCTVKCKS